MKKCDSKYFECLYYSVNALSRVMSKIADEEFSTAGLQSSSYAFLLMTVNENPGIHPKEISDHMQLSASTITRLIEKMELKGLLERKHSGRITEVYPTEKSKILDQKIKDAWSKLHDRFTDNLGEKDSESLRKSIFSAYSKLI